MKVSWKYYLKLYSSAFLGIVALRILGWTYRYRIVGFKNNMIYGIWHGDMFPLIFAFRNKWIYVIVDRGIDGDILGIVLHHFGFRTLRISVPIKHSEWESISEIIKKNQGIVVAMDGPKGPAYTPKKGIFRLYAYAKYKVIFANVNMQAKWTIPVWDRFKIPFPFSRIEVVFKNEIPYIRKS